MDPTSLRELSKVLAGQTDVGAKICKPVAQRVFQSISAQRPFEVAWAKLDAPLPRASGRWRGLMKHGLGWSASVASLVAMGYILSLPIHREKGGELANWPTQLLTPAPVTVMMVAGADSESLKDRVHWRDRAPACIYVSQPRTNSAIGSPYLLVGQKDDFYEGVDDAEQEFP